MLRVNWLPVRNILATVKHISPWHFWISKKIVYAVRREQTLHILLQVVWRAYDGYCKWRELRTATWNSKERNHRWRCPSCAQKLGEFIKRGMQNISIACFVCCFDNLLTLIKMKRQHIPTDGQKLLFFAKFLSIGMHVCDYCICCFMSYISILINFFNLRNSALLYVPTTLIRFVKKNNMILA